MRTYTGVVMTVASHADAYRLRRAVTELHEFAVHEFRVVDASAESTGDELRASRDWARQECHRYGAGSAAADALDAAVAKAPPGTAVAMAQLMHLCIGDTGFILAIVTGRRRVRIASSFLETLQTVFLRTVHVVRSRPLDLPFHLTRPAPSRLDRSLDRELLAATVDDGDGAVRAWNAWRARADLDTTLGFSEIAPMLSENLRRVGIDDVDLVRIDGVRRRAWYLNQLLTRQAATVVEMLREQGIDPVLLDDLPAAVRAADRDSVRPIREISACVQPGEAARAGDVLTRLGWVTDYVGPPIESRLERESWQLFLLDPGHALRLHWRLLPQECSRLTANPDEDDPRWVRFHEMDVKTQSPTAALLRLWARSGDAMPGHQLRTLCDTADLLRTSSFEVDWTRLWSECDRIGLVEYGEHYLRALPNGLGECGLRPSRSEGRERQP